MVTCKQYDSCLSESLILIFDSSLKSADKKSSIERYDLISRDFPVNKKGGVCIYYRDHLPVIRGDDLCTLQDCLVIEIK